MILFPLPQYCFASGPVANSKKSLRNGDMAALMILESTIDEERPAEEEGIPTHIFPSGLVIRILHYWHETKSC